MRALVESAISPIISTTSLGVRADPEIPAKIVGNHRNRRYAISASLAKSLLQVHLLAPNCIPTKHVEHFNFRWCFSGPFCVHT